MLPSSVLFACALDADGKLLFQKSYGKGDAVSRVAQTSAGAIAISGRLNGTIDLGTGPVSAEEGAFVAMLDASGNPQWVKAWSEGVSLNVRGLAPGEDGSLLFTGWDHNYTDFEKGGPGVLAPEDLKNAAFLVGLDNKGSYRFTVRFDQAKYGEAHAEGIGLSEPGSAVLWGSHRAKMSIGAIPLDVHGSQDVFAAEIKLPTP